MPHTSGGAQRESELSALLLLLHGADAPFRTVRATYRIWRHEARAAAALRAYVEEHERRGASFTPYAFAGDPSAPREQEETVRIWRNGDRFREEHSGGHRDGYYAVADGPLWWFWDRRLGASSNQDEPEVSSSVGEELLVMFQPTWLLSPLRFRPTGTSEIAGRVTVSADATPRAYDPRNGIPSQLRRLGVGADRYRFEVDRERGVLLAVIAMHDEQPFQTIDTVTIDFDEPIPAETFVFVSPEGEKIESPQAGGRLRTVTLREAQRQAPFTVLAPDRVPPDWRVHCMLIEASQRLASPAQVSLSYHSEDGHESMSISQSAELHGRSPYEDVTTGENWQEVNRAGTTVRATKPGARQAQAHVARDGTFALLVSDSLAVDELVAIAARLQPARGSRSVP